MLLLSRRLMLVKKPMAIMILPRSRPGTGAIIWRTSNRGLPWEAASSTSEMRGLGAHHFCGVLHHVHGTTNSTIICSITHSTCHGFS